MVGEGGIRSIIPLISLVLCDGLEAAAVRGRDRIINHTTAQTIKKHNNKRTVPEGQMDGWRGKRREIIYIYICSLSYIHVFAHARVGYYIEIIMQYKYRTIRTSRPLTDTLCLL